MQKAVVVEVRARALYHSVVIVVWVAGCVKSFLQADTAACVRYTCRIKTQTRRRRRRRENADVPASKTQTRLRRLRVCVLQNADADASAPAHATRLILVEKGKEKPISFFHKLPLAGGVPCSILMTEFSM